MAKAGPKTIYDPATHPAQARELCADVKLTDKELAAAFGISVATLYNWEKAHPELRVAKLEGKHCANAAVEGAVFKNAVGYDWVEETWERNEAGKLVLTKKVTKHNPGTPTDRIFFLKNREPERWKDKMEQDISHSGEVKVTLYMPTKEPVEKPTDG